MAGDVPRKHHVVSAFHLAEFTDSRKREGRLFIFDKNERNIPPWPTSPSQAARYTDFNRVNVDGVDPMLVEKGFAKQESAVAPIVKQVIDERRIPEGADFDLLIGYIALATLRVPHYRNIFSGFNNQVMKQLTRLNFQGSDGAARVRELLEAEGEPVSDADVLEFQAAIQSDVVTIDFERTWHVQTMLHSIAVVEFLLKQRLWSLWICDDDAPDLVCSDCPLAFMIQGDLPLFASPFTAPNATLLLPIGRRMLLASRVSGQMADPFIMDAQDVALVNTLVAQSANQIYAATDDWTSVSFSKNGELQNWEGYLAERQVEVPGGKQQTTKAGN